MDFQFQITRPKRPISVSIPQNIDLFHDLILSNWTKTYGWDERVHHIVHVDLGMKAPVHKSNIVMN